MAKSFYSTPVSEVYGESTALATTLAYGDILNVVDGFKGLQFYCADAFKFLTTPRIGAVILYDASENKYSDQTAATIDNDASTVVNLGTMATTDILYVGCVGTFLGLAIDISTANTNATTTPPDVEYSTKLGFTDVAGDSDGTLSSTTSFAVDGLYTWTLPSSPAWAKTTVSEITKTQLKDKTSLYFVSFKPLAALSAGTSIGGLVAINKATNYAYFPAAMTQELNYDEDLVGGLQFLAVSGTPTVYVNHIYYKG